MTRARPPKARLRPNSSRLRTPVRSRNPPRQIDCLIVRSRVTDGGGDRGGLSRTYPPPIPVSRTNRDFVRSSWQATNRDSRKRSSDHSSRSPWTSGNPANRRSRPFLTAVLYPQSNRSTPANPIGLGPLKRGHGLGPGVLNRHVTRRRCRMCNPDGRRLLRHQSQTVGICLRRDLRCDIHAHNTAAEEKDKKVESVTAESVGQSAVAGLRAAAVA